MNVLSDILCDTSSLLASQNYSVTSSEKIIMPSQEMFARPPSLNLLDTTPHISAIERPLPSINHSSPSDIDLFNSTSQIHIPQNVNPDFEDRSESVFSDPFAEIVPSWLTHDFMKVSDNLASPSLLSNVSDMYSTSQEDEHLEMLDLGFTPDLTSHDLTANVLNRNCSDDNQKLLAELPIQRFSNNEPILLSSLNEINVKQLQMPLKSNLHYQKFKSSAEVNNSTNLMTTVLNGENDPVHLPISANLTSQCLTSTSSPSIMNHSQNHNTINSVCDKLPQINLNHLDSFLGNEISEMHLLHQQFPAVSLSATNFNQPNRDLSNTSTNINVSNNNNIAPNTQVNLSATNFSHLNRDLSNRSTNINVSNNNNTIAPNSQVTLSATNFSHLNRDLSNRSTSINASSNNNTLSPNTQVNLSATNFSHLNGDLSNISTNMTVSSNNNTIAPNNQDASTQVSINNESENCISCSKIGIEEPIEIIQGFKCKFCDFISLHKCSVQNHLSTHSKPFSIQSGTNLGQTDIINSQISVTNASQNSFLPSSNSNNNIVTSATIVPLNSHISNSMLSSESTYLQSDNQVISKSNYVSGHNLSTAPVQLNINENIPISYQLIPISGVVLSSSEVENGNVPLNCNSQYFPEDAGNNNIRPKQRLLLKKPEESQLKKFTEFKRVVPKTNKDESLPEKLISAQKKGWRTKIRRELGSYICEFKGCNVRFKALDNLEYHRKCHVSGGNAFACPECGISFNNWSTIAGHLWRNHSNDMELHACDKCSFRTYSLSRLENYHKKTHLDECLFLCDTCGKKFKNRKQLRNHRVIHDKKKSPDKHKSFKCRICLTNFKSKALLHSHQDLVHNLKRKVHLCSYCDYSSCKKSTMIQHMRQHTGEKPFQCDECDYKTGDHNSLRRHKMIHSGEKRYKCPFCSYSSIQASSYKDHVKKKHPGEDLVFSCKLCPFRSVKLEAFNNHMEEHESILKHKQFNQMNEINSTEDTFPMVEAMGIRLTNGDSLGYLNGNSQSFVNTVNINMMSLCQENSI